MELFNQSLKVINIGLESFKDSLIQQGVETIGLNWQPPLEGYVNIAHTAKGVSIDEINYAAIEKLRKSHPLLIGMSIASNVIPKMEAAKILLHAGPPVTWEKMCGPLKGAIVGAILYEGWAETSDAAFELAASGEIQFDSCHHHNAVGPMAGVISPSMPVFIVKNEQFSHIAFATMNEGLGKVLRYGAYDQEVIDRLHWMEKILYPVLSKAIEKSGPLYLRNIISQALHMGDEAHNRNCAATSILIRNLAPIIVEEASRSDAVSILRFLDSNDHFFLNLSMAACKATLMAAENIPGCTLVTVMARNGTEFGIQVSGSGNQWFTAPAPMVNGLWLAGYNEKDANPDLGDSAITETLGLGGFSMAAAPAIVRFIGGDVTMAEQLTREMYTITAGEYEAVTIPTLDFKGSPLGIDVRKVMETGILPVINTGIAHKNPGIGMVGAGITRAPGKCFEKAFALIRGNYENDII